MTEPEAFTIGLLAHRSGVHLETIRYYERVGLLDPPARTAAGHRRYGAAAVARLRFIRRARALGFPLDDVRDLLRLSARPAGRSSAEACGEAEMIAARQLEAVRRRRAELQKVEAALAETVAGCRSGGQGACPLIDALGGPEG